MRASPNVTTTKSEKRSVHPPVKIEEGYGHGNSGTPGDKKANRFDLSFGAKHCRFSTALARNIVGQGVSLRQYPVKAKD